MAVALVDAQPAGSPRAPIPFGERPLAVKGKRPVSRTARRTQAYDFGVNAEHSVTMFLVSGGYTILGRRVRLRAGEVDIIAQRGDTISFVEVKARKSGWDGLLSVDRRKQARLSRAVDEWRSKHEEWAHCSISFDIALVWRTDQIEYLANAFEMIEADDFVF